MVPGPFLGSGYVRAGVCAGWVRTNTPWILTPGGGCHKHGRQAGGTHPTGTFVFESK